MEQITMDQFHKKMAVEIFNATWDLMDKQDRTKTEDFEMIHKAHASCYHWCNVEGHTPANIAGGEWQIATVYALLHMGEVSLYHAERSLEICIENNVKDLNLAFAYEAIAKAHKVLGNGEKAQQNKAWGTAACEFIEGEKDKAYTLRQLNGI